MIKNIVFNIDGTLLNSKRDSGAQLWVFDDLCGFENYTERRFIPAHRPRETLQKTFTPLRTGSIRRAAKKSTIIYGLCRPRA